MLSAAADRERVYVIGVDTDWAFSFPDHAAVVLTSVHKRFGVPVVQAVEAIEKAAFAAGTHWGTLGDGGVEPSPFHSKMVAERWTGT